MAWLAAILCLALSSAAQAREDVVPGSRYTSGRAAALGDAFLPLADDVASGLFYNPAGLARVQRPVVEPLNLRLEGNSDYFGNLPREFYKITSLSNYLPSLRSKEGTFPGLGAAFLPNFGAYGFGIGLLYSAQISGSYSSGTVRYRSRYQLIPAAGYGVRLAGGIIRLGYSVQWVNVGVGDVTVPDSTEPLGYDQRLAKGAGLSHTAGFAFTLPVTYLPSLNVVARNVLGTKYSSYSILNLAKNPNGVPETEPMTIDASVSVQPKAGKGAYFNIVAEYRDATNTTGYALLGRLALGLEFSFRSIFFMRGGFSSGYPHAGIGLKRQKADFSLTWYSEELGTSYKESRDTRYMLHYQIRAF